MPCAIRSILVRIQFSLYNIKMDGLPSRKTLSKEEKKALELQKKEEQKKKKLEEKKRKEDEKQKKKEEKEEAKRKKKEEKIGKSSPAINDLRGSSPRDLRGSGNDSGLTSAASTTSVTSFDVSG